MKDTPNDHPILAPIKARWSPRAFLARAVEQEKLQQLFEAARWAPSAGNGQPWFFIICPQGSHAFEQLHSVLSEGNKPWTMKAPLLLLAVAETTLVREGKPTRPNRHALYDVGQAVAFLSLQATELGLSLHQMAGFDAEKAQSLFNIPQEFSAVTVIALGYRAEPDSLSDDLKARELAPRSRKALAEFVFHEAWQRPIP
ncbi:MAG: nitroreductase family protein [Deinococcales bacterium]